MAKQFAFEKAQRNGCAIHFYKRLTLDRAQVVNRASDHLFAGARLALDEDRRVRRRNDSNALEHSLQPRTIPNDLFEIVLKPDFVFQVKLLLRQSVLGLSYLPIFQSVLYRDGDLTRYLFKEPDINLAEGIFLPSAEAQETEDSVPANKWQHATGFETLRDDRVILHAQLKYIRGIACPGLARAEDKTTKRPFHRTVLLSNKSFALWKIEHEGLQPVSLRVRQEDAHQIALHD